MEFTSVWGHDDSHPIERICWVWGHNTKQGNLSTDINNNKLGETQTLHVIQENVWIELNDVDCKWHCYLTAHQKDKEGDGSP